MRNPSWSLSSRGLGRGTAGLAYGFDGCVYRPGIANGGGGAGGGGPRCGPVCCIEYIMVEGYTGLYRMVGEEGAKTLRSWLLLRMVLELPCTGASHANGSTNPDRCSTSQ
jgi:hypothetical protein